MLYRSCPAGLPSSYPDRDLAELMDYWTSALSGRAPELPLPLDKPKVSKLQHERRHVRRPVCIVSSRVGCKLGSRPSCFVRQPCLASLSRCLLAVKIFQFWVCKALHKIVSSPCGIVQAPCITQLSSLGVEVAAVLASNHFSHSSRSWVQSLKLETICSAAAT